jgi:CDGSH-type Zn-finger protein
MIQAARPFLKTMRFEVQYSGFRFENFRVQGEEDREDVQGDLERDAVRHNTPETGATSQSEAKVSQTAESLCRCCRYAEPPHCDNQHNQNQRH